MHLLWPIAALAKLLLALALTLVGWLCLSPALVDPLDAGMYE